MSEKFGKKDIMSVKKTIIYTTESPLTCMAVNPKAEMVAVAGRNLFQVFNVHEDKFVSLHRVKTPSRLVMSDVPIPKPATESSGAECTPNPPPVPLTSTMVESTPSRHSPVIPTAINQPRSHSVTDVSWSNVGDILATASTGGDVMLWDVGRGMTQTACFSGHSRSIHCIQFNPVITTELVTASQDGKLKLFDIRDPNPSSSCRIFFQRTASPSPVRDVAFCPKQGFMVAAAQENGVISIWDTRKGSRPIRAFQGHSCSIATLDWHPNWNVTSCNWLATAGARDHLIKVWNLNSPSGQSSVTCPTVLYTVRTTNVNRVRWRPTFMTQLVSSCNLTIDLSVHVWDLQRPFIPYASFEEHKDLVTCISWCPAETNNFYTVGRDGLLIRHSIKDGIRPAENASPVALSISPYGHILHAVSKDRVEISKKLSIVEEKSSVTYPPIHSSMKNPNQMTNPSRRSSMNIFPPGYYASPNSTSTSSANFTPITTTNNNNSTTTATITGNGTLTCTNPELPTVPVTSVNTDKVLSSLSEPTGALTTTTTTQTVTTTTVSSDQPVSNNSTASTTNNMTNMSTLPTVTTSVTGHQTTSVVNECTVTTPAINKLFNYTSNLPPMGSLKSAKLFVSQAHSLMFHYEPCLEAICQPELASFSNALLPDLIIALARNYKFIGTGVDAICKHNAAVCLRFGQPFLVQFWMLLRSVYGSLGADSLKRTSQQYASQLQSQQMGNIYNRSDFDYQQHNKTVQSSFTNENMATSGFGTTDSSFVRNQDGKMTVKQFQQPGLEKRKQCDTNSNDNNNDNKNSTGVRLSSILESLGFRDPDGRQNEKLTSKIKLDYRRHSSGNVKTRHMLSKQLIDMPPVTQRLLSYSGTSGGVSGGGGGGGGNIPPAVFSALSSSTNPCNEICLPNSNNELLLRTSKPIPVNINYKCLHKSLTAYDNDDQHTSSIPSSGSPPLIQPAQSILRNLDQDISPPNGLLFSNYREDIDYLFHTTNHHHQQQQQQHHHHQSAAENDSFKGRPKQLDLIEVIGSRDDPVIMNTEYLPDEAFPTIAHPLQDHHQSPNQKEESCHIHNQQKHQKVKQRKTVGRSSAGDIRHTTTSTTTTANTTPNKGSVNNNFNIVSCSTETSVSKRNEAASKPQRKSMDCTKILTSKCRELSLVDWENRQILPASSFPGLPFTISPMKEAKTIPQDPPIINPDPTSDQRRKSEEGFQANKKHSSETLVKNDNDGEDHDDDDGDADDDDDDDNTPMNHVSNSSASESPSSSLTKQKSPLDNSKKQVQLLAPWQHHSMSLSGLDKESFALLNGGHTINPIGSLYPINSEINTIIGKWFKELIESGHVQTVCTALLALGPERLRVSEWVSEAQLEHWFISYIELLTRFRLWTVCARIMKQCGNPFAGADNQLYLREYRRSINLQYVIRPIVMKPTESESKNATNTGETRSDGNTRTRWKSGGLTSIDNQFASRNMSPALAPGVAALNQASTTLSIRCGLCTKPLCASESTQRLTGHTGWACSRHATSCDPATITCALCHLVVRGLFVWCRGCSHGGHLDHMQAWLMRRSECPAGCGHRCRYN